MTESVSKLTRSGVTLSIELDRPGHFVPPGEQVRGRVTASVEHPVEIECLRVGRALRVTGSCKDANRSTADVARGVTWRPGEPLSQPFAFAAAKAGPISHVGEAMRVQWLASAHLKLADGTVLAVEKEYIQIGGEKGRRGSQAVTLGSTSAIGGVFASLTGAKQPWGSGTGQLTLTPKIGRPGVVMVATLVLTPAVPVEIEKVKAVLRYKNALMRGPKKGGPQIDERLVQSCFSGEPPGDDRRRVVEWVMTIPDDAETSFQKGRRIRSWRIDLSVQASGGDRWEVAIPVEVKKG